MVNNKHVAFVATFALLGATNGFVPATGLNRAVQLRVRSSLRMADASADARRRAEQAANKVDAKLGEQARVEREVVTEAPIIKERIHEKTVEVDKTRIEEERIRTEVVQRVQPIKDERREQTDVRKVDHGLEVNEHGKAGLDKRTLDELERRRQEVAAKAVTERDATTERVSERPDVVKTSKTNVVEQVIPVVERDVYIPHRVEHEKQIKEIYHEKPTVKATVVEPAITKAEFEAKFGEKVDITQLQQGPGAATSDLRTKVKTEVEHSTSGSSTKHKSEHKTEHKTEHKADHSSDSYSMSSSNMAREADADAGESTEGGGLGSALKAPFKAVSNLVEKIID